MKRTLALLALLLVAPVARAQTELPPVSLQDLAAAGAPVPEDAAPAYAHPTLPERDVAWPAILMMGVIGLFLCAALVGPLYRLEIPDELPPMHSHDEPPGTSHHHGPSGTVQPGPEHDLPGGHASAGEHH